MRFGSGPKVNWGVENKKLNVISRSLLSKVGGKGN